MTTCGAAHPPDLSPLFPALPAQAIYPLNLHERTHLFTPRIPGAHITLFYYGGFSYLMQRR